MTDPRHETLLSLLDDVEQELRVLSLWQAVPPPATAFESTTPFFADRMDFHQWLQWVFTQRFRALLSGHHPLPAVCDIAPMAQQALPGSNRDTARLIALLSEFDSHFDSV